MHRPICLFLAPVVLMLSGASTWASNTLTVGKDLQRSVEATCQLDVFTPMLYQGLTSNVGGKTSFTFNKNCAELQGKDISWKDGGAPIHPKTLLTWNNRFGSMALNANDQPLEIEHQNKSTFRVVNIGRMTLLVFDTQGWLFDNTEQHWCPFPMKFPESKGLDTPLFWYDKASGNVIRFHQHDWNTPIQKTQHYLPAACSNSSPPPIAPKPIRYRINDLPVRLWNGPVILSR